MRKRDRTRGLPWIAGMQADRLGYVPEDLPFQPGCLGGDLEWLVHDMKLYVLCERDVDSYHVVCHCLGAAGSAVQLRGSTHHVGLSLAAAVQAAAYLWLAIVKHPELVEYSNSERIRWVPSFSVIKGAALGSDNSR